MLYDVVIAGAGPVGLFLSCELAHAGCSVLVLEQAGSADSPLKHLPFGLRGLNVPTLEALDRRGLLDAVVATQVLKPDKGAPPLGTAHWLAQPRALGGHFAGIPFALDDVDRTRWSWRLPTPVGTQMAVELQALETVLAERAIALGVRIERGRAVQAVDAHEAQVAVHIGSGRVHGRWLVGCDGARSTVRKQSGFIFAGTGPEFTGYTLLVELADGCVLTPGRQFTDHGMCNFNPPGLLALADFDGGAGHRTPLDRHSAQALLRRVSGREATITALHLATTWTDAARQATAYRSGRVLLAGDAAHMHSPLGGQGLNLGIGDAMNLGWKLAAVVRGKADEALLDSYQSERHPVGTMVARAGCADASRGRLARAGSDHGRPGRHPRWGHVSGRADLGCFAAAGTWRRAPAGRQERAGLPVGRWPPPGRTAESGAGGAACFRPGVFAAAAWPTLAAFHRLRRRYWRCGIGSGGGAGAPGWHRCLDLRHRRRYARP
jgi:2-polyprenyl-6-methoxyphenol hydroxylase and related FAD-dependent oxidoreductases